MKPTLCDRETVSISDCGAVMNEERDMKDTKEMKEEF